MEKGDGWHLGVQLHDRLVGSAVTDPTPCMALEVANRTCASCASAALCCADRLRPAAAAIDDQALTSSKAMPLCWRTQTACKWLIVTLIQEWILQHSASQCSCPMLIYPGRERSATKGRLPLQSIRPVIWMAWPPAKLPVCAETPVMTGVCWYMYSCPSGEVRHRVPPCLHSSSLKGALHTAAGGESEDGIGRV